MKTTTPLLTLTALLLAGSAQAQYSPKIPHSVNDPYLGVGEIDVREWNPNASGGEAFFTVGRDAYPFEFSAAGNFPGGAPWSNVQLRGYGAREPGVWTTGMADLKAYDSTYAVWAEEKLTYMYTFATGLFSDVKILLSSSSGLNRIFTPALNPPAPGNGSASGTETLDYLLSEARGGPTATVPETGGWLVWLVPVGIALAVWRKRLSNCCGSTD
jgi:hypothetical protein